MSSEMKKALIVICICPLMCACSLNRKLAYISDTGAAAEISVPGDASGMSDNPADASGALLADGRADMPAEETGGPLILNAIRDSETGEMVATDVISASVITARFRNVAERAGLVDIEFDVEVPEAVMDSRWKLRYTPRVDMMGDVSDLLPLYITGARYRERQLRGYERYRAFIASIITDSSFFIRQDQLEKFLMRYYPETYSMKNDSSFISEPQAENVFGVSQREALRHYTRHGMLERNENRKRNAGAMFRKYVRDPVLEDGFRLDTILVPGNGNIVYRYVQTLESRPGLRKITVTLAGEIMEDGRTLMKFPDSAPLTFYVSSLSSLADMSPRYRTRIISRVVHDNTRAFIDFRQGSAEVDTLLPGNIREIARIRKSIRDISSASELLLDSMKVSASCSPEGAVSLNSRLAASRAESVLEYFRRDFPDSLRDRLASGSVPENWEQFVLLVAADTVLGQDEKDRIMELSRSPDKDSAEYAISRMAGYRYLREKIYPRLRSVKFEFWLHRKDMEKDTVHTTELDTVYRQGVEAIMNLDYRKAVAILQPYADYNSALACLSAGYEDTALEILSGLESPTASSYYLAAVALVRLGRDSDAAGLYRKSLDMDPRMRHRANLDPEMSAIAKDCDAGPES